MANSPFLRMLFGFAAAAISVVVFHQGMIAVLNTVHLPGLEMERMPWMMDPVGRFGVPRLLDLCFWGGMYGVLFGLVAPWLWRPFVISGVLFGVLAVLIGFFVVAPLKGLTVGGGYEVTTWARAMVINISWGIGLGIIFPLLSPTPELRK